MEAMAMLWTAVGVLGLLCLIGAAFLAFGAPAALASAGVALILSAIDGRR